MADLLAQLERWRRTVVSDEVDADWLEAVHGACNDLAAACAMKLEQSRLLRLPSELLLHVLRYCDAADLAALDSTAKAFHSQLSIVDLAIAGATEHAHGKLVAGHVLGCKKSAPSHLRRLEDARRDSYDWAKRAIEQKAAFDRARATADPDLEDVPEGLYPEGEPDHALAILLTATRAPFRKTGYLGDQFPTPERTHACVVSAILTLQEPPEAAVRWLSEVALHRPEANRAHTINAMKTLASKFGEHEELLVRALWNAATSEEDRDPLAAVQWGQRLGAILLEKTREINYRYIHDVDFIAADKAKRAAARPGAAIEAVEVMRRVLLVQRDLQRDGTSFVTVKPPSSREIEWTPLDTLLELVAALVHVNGVEAMQFLREALDTFASDRRKPDEHPRRRAARRAAHRLLRYGKAVVPPLAKLGRYADGDAVLLSMLDNEALCSDGQEDECKAWFDLSLREVRVKHLLLPQGLIQEAEELMLHVVALRRAALQPTVALSSNLYFNDDEHGPLTRAMIVLAGVYGEQGKTQERAAIGAELVKYYHETVVGIRRMHTDDDDKRWKRVMPPKIIYHGGSDVKWMEESLWKSARLAAEAILTGDEVAAMAIELQAARLASQREELGATDLQVVQSTGLQAYLMVKGGKLAEATQLVEEMVEQLVACFGSHGFDLEEPKSFFESDRISRMTLNHAVKDMSMVLRRLYSQQHLWQRIKELEQTVHEELCTSCGADDKRTVDRLSSLVLACRESGNVKDGIAAGLKLVAARRVARRDEERFSGSDVGGALMLLGTLYRADWQLDAAEECLREAVEIGKLYLNDSDSVIYGGLLGRQMGLLAEYQSANGKHEVARRTQRDALALVTHDEYWHTGKRGRSSISRDECELMLGLAQILWRYVDSLECSEEAADRQASAERAAEACSLVRRVLAAEPDYHHAPVVHEMLERWATRWRRRRRAGTGRRGGAAMPRVPNGMARRSSPMARNSMARRWKARSRILRRAGSRVGTEPARAGTK